MQWCIHSYVNARRQIGLQLSVNRQREHATNMVTCTSRCSRTADPSAIQMYDDTSISLALQVMCVYLAVAVHACTAASCNACTYRAHSLHGVRMDACGVFRGTRTQAGVPLPVIWYVSSSSMYCARLPSMPASPATPPRSSFSRMKSCTNISTCVVQGNSVTDIQVEVKERDTGRKLAAKFSKQQ